MDKLIETAIYESIPPYSSNENVEKELQQIFSWLGIKQKWVDNKKNIHGLFR